MKAPSGEIPGFTSGSVQVGGVELHYRLGGPVDGPPVLLWHGFLSTGHVWRKVMAALAEGGCAVLVPDMRGYGDSDKPGGTEGYDSRSLAEDFRGLVAAVGFGGGRPITLVAHDMGAPPALQWAADHPEEVERVFYMEVPVLLEPLIGKIISFNRETMERGPMWWWVLPFGEGVPERLIVGREREFLGWFFERPTVTPGAIEPEAVDEYLRTFSGTEGVLGALGAYRALFDSMDQAAGLTEQKVQVPVVAVGGERSQGARIAQMVAMVAENVTTEVIPGVGHFLPEESPDELIRLIRTAMSI